MCWVVPPHLRRSVIRQRPGCRVVITLVTLLDWSSFLPSSLPSFSPFSLPPFPTLFHPFPYSTPEDHSPKSTNCIEIFHQALLFTQPGQKSLLQEWLWNTGSSEWDSEIVCKREKWNFAPWSDSNRASLMVPLACCSINARRHSAVVNLN